MSRPIYDPYTPTRWAEEERKKDYIQFWLTLLLGRRHNMSLILKIEKVQNGYILTNETTSDEGEESVYKDVIQDSDEDALKSGEEMLLSVIEFFALSGSRYDKERIRITREQGDKYEPLNETIPPDEAFNNKGKKEVSECCKAKLKVSSDGDLGQKEICTCFYICSKCGKPTDSIWIDK